MAGAVLAIIANGIVPGAHPNAPADMVSYPLSAHDFRLGQLLFAATQAPMAFGIATLASSALGGSGRPARIGARLAVAG